MRTLVARSLCSRSARFPPSSHQSLKAHIRVQRISRRPIAMCQERYRVRSRMPLETNRDLQVRLWTAQITHFHRWSTTNMETINRRHLVWIRTSTSNQASSSTTSPLIPRATARSTAYWKWRSISKRPRAASKRPSSNVTLLNPRSQWLWTRRPPFLRIKTLKSGNRPSSSSFLSL